MPRKEQARGFPVVPPFKAPQYAGSWTLDHSTGGAWLGKYGTAGYQLFAFKQHNDANMPGETETAQRTTPGGVDVVKLPDWVQSVSIFKRGVAAFVGQDARNTSYLTDPQGGPSSLGFVTAGADGSQGTVLDINITATAHNQPYNISLYMVSNVKPKGSQTSSFTKQAIRVMDLATLNPIAPDPLITEANQGVYWTLTYHKGVRLRVMPIDSDAGFSAVFFDK